MRDRQRERERAALAGKALHRKSATVQLDEPLGEREAEPGPFARTLAPDLTELLEDSRLILRRDADARVAYVDTHVIVLASDDDVDAPAVRCELHRIRKQVEQDLLDLALVA